MKKRIIIKIYKNHLTMYMAGKIYNLIRTKENIQFLDEVMKKYFAYRTN